MAVLLLTATLIEPVTVNNLLFLDSMEVAGFLQSHPEYKEQNEQVWKFLQYAQLPICLVQQRWYRRTGFAPDEYADHTWAKKVLRIQLHFNPGCNSCMIRFPAAHITDHGADAINSETELLLTATFFKYAEKIWGGIGEKDVEEVEWFIKKKRLPYVAILDSMLSNPTYFAQQRPVYRQYDLLKSQLKRYYELEKLDNWSPIVADKKSYKPGDSSAVLPAIRKRLFLLGDLATPDTTGTIYESILEVAVKNFQDRHGLAVDGAIGPSMIAAMNVPVSSRIQQIMINMERCRWVPVQLKGDYLAVNIPAYKLFVYEDDSLAWDCNVVVGSVNNQSVIFNGNMNTIVFSPYWNIPASIVAKETLPAVKRNRAYLASHNMEVVSGSGVVNPSSIDWGKYSGYNFPYTIRQKPGPNNSLGRGKISFPQ
jgi:murein L,D-transpeptidase YcbB/YkuD